jgi:uncharacterized protein
MTAIKDTLITDSIKTIKKQAETLFTSNQASHGWDHTLRVFRLCEKIGTAEGADMEVLLIAACLHDIGRCHQDASKGFICHAQRGAEMAEPMLRDISLSEKRKKNVLHCIRAHRFRGNHLPETREAEVLFDADKLDAIGAVGVARAYLFAGEVGAKLHNTLKDVAKTKPYSQEDTGYREFKVKLERIKSRMLTEEGKRLAQGRHAFMVAFFERFLKEIEGAV